MFCYCLFCETIKCSRIARDIESLYGIKAINPIQVQHTWSKGSMVDIEHSLLPGYIFLYSEEKLDDMKQMLRTVDGVIRPLSGVSGYELSGNDEQFALMLLSKDGVIGRTKVYTDGQMIHICEGAFENAKVDIVKVDHRNRRIQIQMFFTDQMIKTWVNYEMVED